MNDIISAGGIWLATAALTTMVAAFGAVRSYKKLQIKTGETRAIAWADGSLKETIIISVSWKKVREVMIEPTPSGRVVVIHTGLVSFVRGGAGFISTHDPDRDKEELLGYGLSPSVFEAMRAECANIASKQIHFEPPRWPG